MFYGCNNYKKALELSNKFSLQLKDSLVKLNRENVWLKDSVEKLYSLKEDISVKDNEIKRLKDSICFFDNIKQIPFNSFIFRPGSIYEIGHDYKIKEEKGSAFYGAENVKDFFIYEYYNVKIFDNKNMLCFEITYLNKDKRNIWVRSFVDKDLPQGSFTCMPYENLTPEFQEFYEKNFIKK